MRVGGACYRCNPRYASFFWKKRNEATAEVPQSGHVAYLMSRLGRLLLAAIWLAPTLVFIGAIAEDGLALHATWSATRAILPVFLGAWLTWQSLLALFRLAGWGNKVLALFSIAVTPRLFTLPAPPCWRTLAGKAPNTSPGHATTSMLWSHPCRGDSPTFLTFFGSPIPVSFEPLEIGIRASLLSCGPEPASFQTSQAKVV